MARRVVAAERADLVQIHTFGSQAIAVRVGRRLGALLVRTEHSTRVHDDRRCCWWSSRRSLVQADAVVALGHRVRAVALALAPGIARRRCIICGGVDTMSVPVGAGSVRPCVAGELSSGRRVLEVSPYNQIVSMPRAGFLFNRLILLRRTAVEQPLPGTAMKCTQFALCNLG